MMVQAKMTKKGEGVVRENDTIGIFYETPEGKIAYTYGWSGKGAMVHYRFNDTEGGREISDAEFQQWKPRNDLRDWPDTKDPRLPYVFDLLWDIKYLSQLRGALEGNHEDADEMRELMAENGITLDWPGNPYKA